MSLIRHRSIHQMSLIRHMVWTTARIMTLLRNKRKTTQRQNNCDKTLKIKKPRNLLLYIDIYLCTKLCIGQFHIYFFFCYEVFRNLLKLCCLFFYFSVIASRFDNYVFPKCIYWNAYLVFSQNSDVT